MSLADIIAKPNRGFGPGQYLSNNKIICVDGFRLSVISGEGAYCSPRDNEGPYVSVEVGYPSERPEPWDRWGQYAEDGNSPTSTVYGWVPVDLVRALVAAHGGEA